MVTGCMTQYVQGNWRDGLYETRDIMFPVGIDVSKDTLDLCMLYDGIKLRVKTHNIISDCSAVANISRWLRLQHY